MPAQAGLLHIPQYPPAPPSCSPLSTPQLHGPPGGGCCGRRQGRGAAGSCGIAHLVQAQPPGCLTEGVPTGRGWRVAELLVRLRWPVRQPFFSAAAGARPAPCRCLWLLHPACPSSLSQPASLPLLRPLIDLLTDTKQCFHRPFDTTPRCWMLLLLSCAGLSCF